MEQSAIGIRRATERDQQAIRALVHGERLNPTGLDWPNFLVAAIDGRIIGAVQMRKHSDGSRELGSLVVTKAARGRGIASRLIDALLAEDREPVWMITSEPYAGTYSQWGFNKSTPRDGACEGATQPSDGKPRPHHLLRHATTGATAGDPGAPPRRTGRPMRSSVPSDFTGENDELSVAREEPRIALLEYGIGCSPLSR